MPKRQVNDCTPQATQTNISRETWWETLSTRPRPTPMPSTQISPDTKKQKPQKNAENNGLNLINKPELMCAVPEGLHPNAAKKAPSRTTPTQHLCPNTSNTTTVAAYMGGGGEMLRQRDENLSPGASRCRLTAAQANRHSMVMAHTRASDT